MPTLEALVLSTVLVGFLGIVFKRNLIMKIIAMDVMSTGVIAFYVLIASRTGVLTPILLSHAGPKTVAQAGESAAAYADPVPQAVILTAIVIGFSIQALMLVGVMKLSRDNPTLDAQSIEEHYSS
ncbi:MAG: multicomponent Na+:H+ antiporter subunit MnhC [Phormidesmis priestleyi Ana]|uniref:Multicomponent Na+:H+ antiporter subunit MnhC n=1 Tax=Phormidesmis priestleyi Ana TaxID=1666911 RepID=A0A0P8C1N4_9CYAN|nr:MAG: multicomponent Na+:H+ antiporter subunit MnhC [Phormidesmis priestleyi Ana]